MVNTATHTYAAADLLSTICSQLYRAYETNLSLAAGLLPQNVTDKIWKKNDARVLVYLDPK